LSERREPTRAELVRARRAQRVTQAMGPSAPRPYKPVAHVTTQVGATHPQAAPGRNTGAVLHPSWALLRARTRAVDRSGYWRWISAGLVLLLGFSLYLMWTLPYFRVPAITLTGNNRLTREEIEAVLAITGQSIFMLQPQDLALRLRLQYPELTAAEVKVYLPNYVFVEIAERRPVILWQQGPGFTWVDADGVAFRPRGDAGDLVTVAALDAPPAGDLPSGDPLHPPAFMAPDLVAAILTLAPQVPDGAVLSYDAYDGLGWEDGRGWKAAFGTGAAEMPLKLRVYQSLVESLAAEGRIPEYINVAFTDAPYFRMGYNADSADEIDSGY
jgi:cell division protein FtsQ